MAHKSLTCMFPARHESGEVSLLLAMLVVLLLAATTAYFSDKQAHAVKEQQERTLTAVRSLGVQSALAVAQALFQTSPTSKPPAIFPDPYIVPSGSAPAVGVIRSSSSGMWSLTGGRLSVFVPDSRFVDARALAALFTNSKSAAVQNVTSILTFTDAKFASTQPNESRRYLIASLDTSVRTDVIVSKSHANGIRSAPYRARIMLPNPPPPTCRVVLPASINPLATTVPLSLVSSGVVTKAWLDAPATGPTLPYTGNGVPYAGAASIKSFDITLGTKNYVPVPGPNVVTATVEGPSGVAVPCQPAKFYKIPDDLTCYNKISTAANTGNNAYAMVSAHRRSAVFYENRCFPSGGQTSGTADVYFLINVKGVRSRYHLGDIVQVNPDAPIPAALTYQLSQASNPDSWSTKESQTWTTKDLDIQEYFPAGRLYSSPNPNATGNGIRSDGTYLMSVTRGQNNSRRDCQLSPTVTAAFPGCW